LEFSNQLSITKTKIGRLNFQKGIKEKSNFWGAVHVINICFFIHFKTLSLIIKKSLVITSDFLSFNDYFIDEHSLEYQQEGFQKVLESIANNYQKLII